MHIFIKNLRGESVTLDVDGTDLIEEVMQKIKEKEGIEAEIKLIYAGKELLKGHSLTDYEIFKETTIHMTLAFKGN